MWVAAKCGLGDSTVQGMDYFGYKPNDTKAPKYLIVRQFDY